ncbi:hypothetical protein SKUN_001536 [Spiroplasma kunkelii CR2-3x]|uniref:Uncharacterized protein n=1 Tax=Spiroplasma kunkelii CR2-3x TaxID=273035 RepID=A0A0K2JII1_SPIKU|nr:hypothetical protein [Spiroplasma kunkelii]ALA98394.1 hypothetical protein SKUN_001536 [Spiroplasma kunkelii CR2-3x]
MNITESIKFGKLQEENDALKAENETLKKELAEKDKEWEKLVLEIYDLQQRQLYKEDFRTFDYCINCGDELFIIDNMKKRKKEIKKVNINEKCNICGWKRIIDLKDSSKYDKLPSKEEK